MDGVTAYPLTWPAHRPRTPASRRKAGAFRTQRQSVGYRSSEPIRLTDARERLADIMDRIGARYPVLSTNLELRLDGQPRAGQREPADPGVAVYFRHRGKPIVLSCDRYESVAANIAAIVAHLDAVRTIERHGVGTLEQMFEGFAALPPPAAPQPWRAVLGLSGEAVTAAIVRLRYRELARRHHPDVAGGNHDRMAEINEALDQALQELGEGKEA